MKEPKINKAVSRAIDILEYIAHTKESVTLAELNKNLDVPKSSIFDIMQTLVDKKMLAFDPVSKSYFWDIKSFEIGNAYLSKNDIHSVALPYLKSISEQTSETVFMAVENNGMIVYLDKVEGTSPTRTTCNIGDRNSMHCTGLGKAILATYPIEKIRLITGGGALQAHTKNTLKSFDELMDELKRTRERGYSIDRCEDNDYVFCVACPILNVSGKCIASISISCVYTPAAEEKTDFYSQLISKAALDISNKFGFLGTSLFEAFHY